MCGHNPYRPDGSLVKGKLGDNLSVAQGYDAAKFCAISILATLEQALGGDWSKLVRIVKLVGFCNSTADFTDHPSVINGASDLLVALLGPDVGSHARSAVGMMSLPFGIAVEVECIVQVKGD